MNMEFNISGGSEVIYWKQFFRAGVAWLRTVTLIKKKAAFSAARSQSFYFDNPIFEAQMLIPDAKKSGWWKSSSEQKVRGVQNNDKRDIVF